MRLEPYLDLARKTADEGPHLKCLQAVLREEAEKPVEKFRFGEESGRRRHIRRELEHQESESA